MVDRRTIVTGLGALATSAAAMAAETRRNRTSADYAITSADYAIDPTGVTDSAPGLNLAIQDAITQNKKLVLPSGVFLLNSPLLCFKPGTQFCTVNIEGQGGFSYPSDGLTVPTVPFYPDINQTVLYINSLVLPAIIFQQVRYSSLKGVAILGRNTKIYKYPPTDNRNDYILSGCATGYQSPYCAIAIDPFTPSTPKDGGYPGYSSYYGATPSGSGTSGLKLEDVHIRFFVVGIALSVAGNLQADNQLWNRITITYCDTAIAGACSQSRDWIVSQGSIAYCRQAFDIVSYGASQNNNGTANPNTGANPIAIRDIMFGDNYRLFNLNYSTCVIEGCYSEAFAVLGGSNSSSFGGAVTFVGCHWSPSDQVWSLPPLMWETGGPTIFKGCTFSAQSHTVGRSVWNFNSWYTVPISFEGCYFTGPPIRDLPPYIGIGYSGSYNGQYGARITDCVVYGYYNSFAITDNYQRSYGIAFSSNGFGRLRALYNTHRVTDGNLTYYYQPPAVLPYIAITASSLTMMASSDNIVTSGATPGISSTNPTVIHINTVSGSNPYKVGQFVTISGVGSGSVTHINNRNCVVTAIGGSSGAWTVTVYCDTSNTTSFTPYVTGSGGTLSALTLTFTESTLGEIMVGDILLWQMLSQGASTRQYSVPAWKVISVDNVTTGNVVAWPLWTSGNVSYPRRGYYDTVANNPANVVNVCLQQWAPTSAMTGTTNTDTSLTSVTPTALINNDWVTGAGIPAKTRVVSGGGTATLVLSKATTARATGVRLYYGRLLIPTTTVAF